MSRMQDIIKQLNIVQQNLCGSQFECINVCVVTSLILTRGNVWSRQFAIWIWICRAEKMCWKMLTSFVVFTGKITLLLLNFLIHPFLHANEGVLMMHHESSNINCIACYTCTSCCEMMVVNINFITWL